MTNRKPQAESKGPIAEQADAQSTDNGKPNESRRRFTKAGLLAPPVLMSVASRPVFGVQCLSQALSGNMSHHGEGGCNLGESPTFWMEFLTTSLSCGTSCDLATCGSEGPLFSLVDGSDPTPMYSYLCDAIGSNESHYVAAYLNASGHGGQVTNYVLTVAQVKSMWAGDYDLQISNDIVFLQSTW